MFEHTPFYVLACNGQTKVIKYWIVSGREIDTSLFKEKKFKDLYKAPMSTFRKDALALLTQFEQSPDLTRYKLRVEAGHPSVLPSIIFAIVVFLCDGYYTIKEKTQTTLGAMDGQLSLVKEEVAGMIRFFRLMRQLPMELQMVFVFFLFLSSETYFFFFFRSFATESPR